MDFHKYWKWMQKKQQQILLNYMSTDAVGQRAQNQSFSEAISHKEI